MDFTEGSEIWFLSGQFADKPTKGIITKHTNIDNICHTYFIEVNGQTFTSSPDIMFDHKPQYVKRTDEFGDFHKWV